MKVKELIKLLHDDCLIIKLLIKLRDSIERLEEKQQ